MRCRDEDVRASLPLVGSDGPPLSPSSDLLKQLRRARDAGRAEPPLDCEQVVKQHESATAQALRMRIAARALQQAAERERLLQRAERDPSSASAAMQQQSLALTAAPHVAVPTVTQAVWMPPVPVLSRPPRGQSVFA